MQRIRAGLGGAESLPSWDERLAAEAEPLMEARSEAVDALAGTFSELASVSACPRPRSPIGLGRPAAATELAAELGRRRAEDLGRAYTSYGPQLDEVELRLAGRALRRFGSQGQQRIALLALLFAERAALIEAGRSAPLMLLDDVMSELDPATGSCWSRCSTSGGQARDHGDGVGARPSANGARIEVSRRSRRCRARSEGRMSAAGAHPDPSRRRIGAALERAEPETLLAAVQSAWPAAVGEAIAREATPVSERYGVVTVACRSSAWAQELDLLSGPDHRANQAQNCRSGTPLQGLASSLPRIPSNSCLYTSFAGICDGSAQFPVRPAGRLICT